MGDLSEAPNNTQLQAVFDDCSNGDGSLDKDELKRLCYKFYLSPTSKDIDDLFKELDKNSDEKLSFDEVKSYIQKIWTSMEDRKMTFVKDLRSCRQKKGPIDREELKEILTQGDEEALNDEDIDFIFSKMDLDGNKEITEEELGELLFRMEEALSRAPTRGESRRKNRKAKSRSRSRSRSKDRKRSGSRERKRSGSRERKRSGSRERKRSGSRERKRSRSNSSEKKKSRSRSSSSSSSEGGRGSRSEKRKEQKTEQNEQETVINIVQQEAEPSQKETKDDNTQENIEQTDETSEQKQEQTDDTSEQKQEQTDETNEQKQEQEDETSEQKQEEGDKTNDETEQKENTENDTENKTDAQAEEQEHDQRTYVGAPMVSGT